MTAATSSFGIFMREWPNKQARAYAEECWDRAVKKGRITVERDLIPMLKFIEVAKKSRQWQEEDGKFIPRASTFINQRHWIGDPPPEAVTSATDSETPPMTDDDQSYEVVAPPVGATVPYLPEEAKEETVGGKKYFVHEATYYRAFASDGDTIFMVVEDPRT